MLKRSLLWSFLLQQRRAKTFGTPAAVKRAPIGTRTFKEHSSQKNEAEGCRNETWLPAKSGVSSAASTR
jgi:hypothetical protein